LRSRRLVRKCGGESQALLWGHRANALAVSLNGDAVNAASSDHVAAQPIRISLRLVGHSALSYNAAGGQAAEGKSMARKPAKASSGRPSAANGRGYQDILYEVKDQVAWVTINRPRVLNAFREQSLDELIDALKATRNDPSIACAVVTGAGDRAFSAGGDFYAMMRLNWTNAAMWNDRMQGLAMTIRGLPIPVIAMVNGWCMGGGHELALWCDLVIASENAVLGQTGAKVGACPTVGATQYLPRIIGERLAREMIFCARRFTAKEAVEIGLINKCVPQQDLLKETLAWCETIKGHSPQTLRMTKKSLNFESDLLYASWQHGMEMLAHVWGSEESLEGMNAFLQGRKADFQKFRMRNKQELEAYLEGCAKDLNAPPSMRKGARKNGKPTR
jgi:naphthoate synthase